MKDDKEQYELRRKLNYKFGDRILTTTFKLVKDIVATLKTFEVNLEILRNNNPRERKPTEDKSKSKNNKLTTATTVTILLSKQLG